MKQIIYCQWGVTRVIVALTKFFHYIQNRMKNQQTQITPKVLTKQTWVMILTMVLLLLLDRNRKVRQKPVPPLWVGQKFLKTQTNQKPIITPTLHMSLTQEKINNQVVILITHSILGDLIILYQILMTMAIPFSDSNSITCTSQLIIN